MNVFEKAQKIVQQQKDVYDAGYEKGKAEAGGAGSYEEGFEAGKQAEKSDWWDKFQLNGTRVRYNGAFMGFFPELFFPEYDMTLINTGADMFRQFGYKNGKKNEEDCIDLAQRLEDCDVILNLSKVTFLNYAFYDTIFTRVPVVDSSNASTMNYCFANNAYLITIDGLVLKNDGSQTFTAVFDNCNELVTMIISSGVIGQNGFNMRWSTKLSKASITSVVNALSTTTSGLSITLSLAAVNSAFEGGSTGAEWTTLAGTRSNWTINLV